MNKSRNIDQEKCDELQGCLTLDQAAQVLTETFNKKFDKGQVLQFALNDSSKFTISAYLFREMLAYPYIEADEHGNAKLEYETYSLKIGIYDLPMIGRERYTVQYAWMEYIGENRAIKGMRPYELQMKRGTFVKDTGDGKIYAILKPLMISGSVEELAFSADSGLPEDTVLVVRKNILQNLIDEITIEIPKKEKLSSEIVDNTNLCIIALLVEEIIKNGIFKNEFDLRDHLHKKNIYGCSESNLGKRFSEAKKSLKNARKKKDEPE